MNAVGIIESSSIAKGIELCDAMVKASAVKIIEAIPLCPGKYVILISGSVAEVENSVSVAAERAGSMLVDKLIIPNIDDRVFRAINCTTDISIIDAIGIVETYSVASGVLAADTAVKAAQVELLEVRLSRGMGGKAFIVLTGNVSDVSAAVNAGCEVVKTDGMLAGYSVIPSPHEDFKRFLS